MENTKSPKTLCVFCVFCVFLDFVFVGCNVFGISTFHPQKYQNIVCLLFVVFFPFFVFLVFSTFHLKTPKYCFLC